MLKCVFVLFYVLLAPLVGAFADSMPKGRVMFVSNSIKIAGCMLLFLATHQFLALSAYAIVGLGAASYSPAKYGILTELLPPEKLVIANGWMQGCNVGAILLCIITGGLLINHEVSSFILSLNLPGLDFGIDTAVEVILVVMALFYAMAALIKLFIPNTGIDHRILKKNPLFLI